MPGIDLLRTFAILCVVLNHCTEQLYHFYESSFALLSFPNRVFAFTSFTLGRMGVPCFLTITGYLLLDRVYLPDKAKQFWKDQWLHLLLCTWIWFTVYDGILTLTGTPVTPAMYIKHLLFLQAPAFSHVWYMPAIIGLYLLIPVLANGLRQFQGRGLLWILALLSCYAFVFPTINIVLGIMGQEPLDVQLSPGFSGGAYGLYILMGGMIRKGVFRSVRAWIVGLLAIFSFAGTVGFQLWCYHAGTVYMVWYTFPLLYLLGICLLELTSRLSWIPCFPLFTILARYSFAVYLIHNIFLKWLIPWGASLPVIIPLQVLIVFLFACTASYLCGFCIARIPKIGFYILYVKAPRPNRNS